MGQFSSDSHTFLYFEKSRTSLPHAGRLPCRAASVACMPAGHGMRTDVFAVASIEIIVLRSEDLQLLAATID